MSLHMSPPNTSSEHLLLASPCPEPAVVHRKLITPPGVGGPCACPLSCSLLFTKRFLLQPEAASASPHTPVSFTSPYTCLYSPLLGTLSHCRLHLAVSYQLSLLVTMTMVITKNHTNNGYHLGSCYYDSGILFVLICGKELTPF